MKESSEESDIDEETSDYNDSETLSAIELELMVGSDITYTDTSTLTPASNTDTLLETQSISTDSTLTQATATVEIQPTMVIEEAELELVSQNNSEEIM